MFSYALQCLFTLGVNWYIYFFFMTFHWVCRILKKSIIVSITFTFFKTSVCLQTSILVASSSGTVIARINAQQPTKRLLCKQDTRDACVVFMFCRSGICQVISLQLSGPFQICSPTTRIQCCCCRTLHWTMFAKCKINTLRAYLNSPWCTTQLHLIALKCAVAF